jgi:hypothetical protein
LRELVRTQDAVLASAIKALLDGADIPHLAFDDYPVWGLPALVRILVQDQHFANARRLLTEAGLDHETG